ncbi:MAG: hypothetical protein AB8C46_23320 [Burkholderiaceae bacterium]
MNSSIRNRRRWIGLALLFCIGFFQVTVAFSACLPSTASPHTEHSVSEHALGGAETGHGSMRVSDLLCKTHCDSENVQASTTGALPPAEFGLMTLFAVPALEWRTVSYAVPPVPDLIEQAAPDPVYLLSARLRV